MKHFFNYYIEAIQKQKKVSKGYLYFAVVGILLSLSIALTLPNYLLKQQEQGRAQVVPPPPPPPPSSPPSIQVTIGASPASASAIVGSPFSIDIVVDGGGQAFNAAQATVTVSPNLSVTGLSITPLASGGCNFTYTQTPTITNPSFAGAILATSSTLCKVYNLTLSPLSAGTGTITFTNASVKAYSDNSEILSSVINGSYPLTAPTPTPVPPTPTNTPVPPTATTAPTATPVPPTATAIPPTPTNTPTNTPVPPTATPVPPTPTRTPTPVPPTPTNTPTPLPTSTPTPTGILLAAPIVTSPTAATYQSSLTLSGTKITALSSIYVNNSASGIVYPTNTSWQIPVTLIVGANTFTIYGKDSLGNQSPSTLTTINRNRLGDIDGNNLIDLTDISLFATDWLKTSGFNYALSNMNGDSIVDLTDFSIIAKQYGQ